MTTEPEAVIYLSDARGCTQNVSYRSFHTFNYGKWFSEFRKPFKNLAAFNDETLAAKASIKHFPSKDCLVLILPLVGDVECRRSNAGVQFGPGQSHMFYAQSGSEVLLINPFTEELINYLYIELLAGPEFAGINSIDEFDIEAHNNKLISVYPDIRNVAISIGQFDGRHDDVYTPNDPAEGIFAFVIEGAFEVQNRLLHPRDGLALWKLTTVEFEALSNKAMILLIDVRG